MNDMKVFKIDMDGMFYVHGNTIFHVRKIIARQLYESDSDLNGFNLHFIGDVNEIENDANFSIYNDGIENLKRDLTKAIKMNQDSFRFYNPYEDQSYLFSGSNDDFRRFLNLANQL